VTVVLHTADLHLCREEEEYSLGVLEEIVSLALSHGAGFLILAGDVFDSYAEAQALRSRFRKALEPLAGRCAVLYLPGNHEQLKRGSGSLRSLELGPLTLLDQTPCRLLRTEQVEFLAVPHQDSYAGYRQWQVPARCGIPRLGIAHGIVAGMAYTGSEQEGGGGALDPDLFKHLQVDYAALGHIHSRRLESLEDLPFSYPGSARVWRRGELGERGVNLLRLGPGVETQFLPLRRAGQYRERVLPLGLEGEPEGAENFAGPGQENDWLRLLLTGVVEDEHAVSLLESSLKRELAPRLRRLEVDREAVSTLPGIASHPLARKFLQAWRQLEPGEQEGQRRRVWLRARELALLEIKAALEARR